MLQNQLAESILTLYPDAVVKKINKDNYLDIHLPQLNQKKGTHLFFNTTADTIKIGFYCRDEEFNKQILSKSDTLEKYTQGIRLKDNPEFSDGGRALEKAVEFINSILKGAKMSGAKSNLKDAKFSKFFERIKAAYGRCSIAEEKNYASFTFKAAYLYELRIQKDIIRLLAANYPKKASIERSLEVIAKHEISSKLINNQYEILVEEGKINPDKLTVRVEIPYILEDMESDKFIDKIIACCEEFHITLMPLINEFQPEPVGTLKDIVGGEKVIESSPTNREQSIPTKTENFIGQDSSLAPDQNAENTEEEEEDEKGFPMLNFRKPSEDLKDVVNAYLKKWQKPSHSYAWRMGITAYIPEFVEELVSDDVCPVFTNEQIKTIYDKISNEKVIPILDYAPEDLYFHTKQVWWIVPFCIWKDDTASMIFVDKNGFYALLEEDGDIDIQMIFPWDKVDQLDFEYAADDDPNVCRLTLYQDNGGYLTFDEFISEKGDNDHGSYLHVIEAIWEARRETIEASKGQSFWLEGEGGETFKVYEHPLELCKSDDEAIAEKIAQVKTIVDFYSGTLVLESESSRLLEYVEPSRREDRGTSCIIEVIKPKQIEVYFKTTNENYIKNAQNEGFLSKNFEWKDGLLKLKGDPSFSEAFIAVKTLCDKANYLYMNGDLTEVDSSKAYYIGLFYYGNHPFDDPKYSAIASSMASAKDLILFRGDDAQIYIDIIKKIHKDATELLDSVLDFIRKEIEFRSKNSIKGIGLSELNRALTKEIEQGKIDLALYAKTHLYFDARYEQVSSIKDFDALKNFFESGEKKIDGRFVYAGLSENLQKDVAVLEYMLSTTRNVFSLFPEEVKKDKTFILNWIKKTQQALKQAEDQKAVDPENEDVIKAYEAANTAAGLAPVILMDMDDSLVNDAEILKAALLSKYVSFIEKLDSEKWAIDKDWAVKAANLNINSVHYLPKPIKNDPEVCKALLNVHLSAYNFFEEEMKRNVVVQTYALKKDGNVFFIFPEDLKCNKAFIKGILNECYDNDDNRGHMIFAMCDELSSNQELIDLAVERNPSIFKKIVAPNDYTKDVFKHYLKVSPYILKLVPDALQDDRDLMIAMLSGGFDGHKRKSLFQASSWYNDEAFALDLVKTSDYSYSLQSLREDFQSKPEIVVAFLKKFPEPEHIAVLPAKQLGVEFFKPLLDQNLDLLYFIGNKVIADNLFENHKAIVLEKVRYADLRFFDKMGALNGNPEVFKAFMQNPLITSSYLEQPGYYIEQDESLMEEIIQLLIHFQHPFFNDRFNKGVDKKGLSFEAKSQDRLEYIQSLSGNETALFKLLLSDPSPQIREEAAKRIGLDEAAVNEMMDKGVPIVTHCEYGKSIIVDQKDFFVLRGLLMNPIFEGLPTTIKEKLKSFINNHKEMDEVKMGNLKQIKIILNGIGSEVVQGLISHEELREFNQFVLNNPFSNKSEAWIAYLEEKGLEGTSEEIKEYYWDYNDVSHFTGINLEEVTIEVYSGDEKLLFYSTYQDIRNNYEDFLEENLLNNSEEYGKYFYPKASDCLVTYKSRENLIFTFQILNHSDFDPKKLGIVKVSTDEMGNGIDYGDYALGIVYDGEKYDAVDHSSWGGDFEVYFES